MTYECAIQGFPGYLVTSDGHVLSCLKNYGMSSSFSRLRPSTDAKGYLGLTLCGPMGLRRKARVHRIVAEAMIPNPENLACVRHLDGNPANNVVENLAWGTYSQNEQDKRRHGTYEARRNGKLTKENRSEVASMSEMGFSQKAISSKFGVSRPTITRLLNGATWGVI